MFRCLPHPTLRNWEKKGLLKPNNYTKGGDRRYKLDSLKTQCQVKRLVLTHKDRFGAELVFAICEAKEVEVVTINQGDENVCFTKETTAMPCFEEELDKDVLEIIAVFSARLYGARSKKNRQLLEQMQAVVEK
ncbi:MerR family transcriptional regulator [Helicobacter mehlei]|uniref:MerR family transcriptional regulator n=1 Tax=Helicobacter mehlei TaxID=2316080 RepID=A0A553UQ79_9HELI|nr:MerR family transcriptional regulator [Helicobacter mehlei]TSA82377.1 MerR family transcriptional regulator [Helicobacter mehlei]